MVSLRQTLSKIIKNWVESFGVFDFSSPFNFFALKERAWAAEDEKALGFSE